MHLWEFERDTVVIPDDEAENWCDTLDELISALDRYAPDILNQVYGWEWLTADESSGHDTFIVHLHSASHRFNYTCPVKREQEAEVLAWLRGPRVLGALRHAWAPLLTEETAP